MISRFDYLYSFLFCVSCIILFGYFWYLFVLARRFEEFEKRLMVVEKDSKAIHNAIKQLNENQKLFIKVREPVLLVRQEEKFHE